MNSRLTVSIGFILIAANVLASQGAGLLRKFKVCDRGSATHVLRATSTPLEMSRLRPEALSLTPGSSLSISPTRHDFCSQAQRLEQFVRNLIDSDR